MNALSIRRRYLKIRFWLSDIAAGLLMIVFIVAAFVLSSAAADLLR